MVRCYQLLLHINQIRSTHLLNIYDIALLSFLWPVLKTIHHQIVVIVIQQIIDPR